MTDFVPPSHVYVVPHQSAIMDLILDVVAAAVAKVKEEKEEVSSTRYVDIGALMLVLLDLWRVRPELLVRLGSQMTNTARRDTDSTKDIADLDDSTTKSAETC
nr:hypothetical protein [Tanacetum cinerariifolium]